MTLRNDWRLAPSVPLLTAFVRFALFAALFGAGSVFATGCSVSNSPRPARLAGGQAPAEPGERDVSGDPSDPTTGSEALADAGEPAAPVNERAGNQGSRSPVTASAGLAPADDTDDDDSDVADDLEEEDEESPSTPSARTFAVHPLDGVSDAEVFRRLKENSTALGSMSIGLPNGGVLINGVQLPSDTHWTLVDPAHEYGTQETVDYLVQAMTKAATVVPDTPPYFIGHLSARSGGFLRPHRSHQSGRDVDIGYVYQGGGKWYQLATEQSLDRARTWALVRALITETDPQFILIDHQIQALLYEYALQAGEDQVWLDDIFKGTRGLRPPLIRHAKGHATHLHVRFWNPIAEQTARRCYAGLIRLGRITPPTHFVTHKAKKGETLIALAKRYGTTVRAIKQANHLRTSKIMARREYKIPQRGVSPMGPRTVVPERRLPPAPATARAGTRVSERG
jgi:penicillin-insensitive murein endopeptidase